tara:strand:- start:8032 stop:8202 length:171 start_codon:yes stop_codon:yes gene_type:complete
LGAAENGSSAEDLADFTFLEKSGVQKTVNWFGLFLGVSVLSVVVVGFNRARRRGGQ